MAKAIAFLLPRKLRGIPLGAAHSLFEIAIASRKLEWYNLE